MSSPLPLERLVDQFRKLPSVGQKSAIRMAYHVLSMSETDVQALADAIVEAKQGIGRCRICQNLSAESICTICSDETREKDICVVEDPRAVSAIESTKEFKGTYHVLHGVLSPIDGIGPENLTIKELLLRVEDAKEIIVATNPSVEGDATAIYLSKLLKPLGIKMTRLAYGIPVGASLEYTDSVTLSRAIEGRREF